MIVEGYKSYIHSLNFNALKINVQVQALLIFVLLFQSVETVLGITLKDDIMNNFSDGVILCQLVNRLFPYTIPSIMEGEVCVEPRIVLFTNVLFFQSMTTIKRTKNIDSFLRACSKLGIKTVSIAYYVTTLPPMCVIFTPAPTDVQGGRHHGLQKPNEGVRMCSSIINERWSFHGLTEVVYLLCKPDTQYTHTLSTVRQKHLE